MKFIFLTDFIPDLREGLERFMLHLDGSLWRFLSGEPKEWAIFYFQILSAEDKREWFSGRKQEILGRIHELLLRVIKDGNQ